LRRLSANKPGSTELTGVGGLNIAESERELFLS
jgi:hypothetical protein